VEGAGGGTKEKGFVENEVSCTEEQMEGAVGDRAGAGTTRKILKRNVETVVQWSLGLGLWGKECQEGF
jgi:hypothetical protein